MCLTNDNLAMELSNWATKHEDKHIFTGISNECNSYYVNRNSEETYLMEYSIKTAVDLKGLLERFSGLEFDAQMINQLVSGICQNKFNGKQEINRYPLDEFESKKSQNSEETLPEFIYVF